ncbi:Ig-like domain-containing protein, partial [Candidatus Woesearchaeota archaeon]|nr:Ig-like domain-containing protein [Candidatus Woesearchaeota archaeon]
MKRFSVISLIFSLLFILSCEDKKDTTPPEVTITSPTNGSKVNEVITVSCMSTDNKEVSKVELWVDGVNTGLTDETEPYSFQWNTTTYKDGDHTLIVRSYDSSDNEGDSPPITVKVDNTVSVPVGVSVKSVNFLNGGFSIDWSKS